MVHLQVRGHVNGQETGRIQISQDEKLEPYM